MAADSTPAVAALTTALDAPLLALQTELGLVDISLQKQKTKTQTADEFIAALGAGIKKWEPTIAASMGGYESTGYKEFFPKGLAEYTQPAKKTVELITGRLFELGGEYSAMLPADTVIFLTAQKTAWLQLDENQSTSCNKTAGSRNQRSKARNGLELALLTAIHAVAGLYPGNVNRGTECFNFSLLKAARHSSLEKDPPQPPAQP